MKEMRLSIFICFDLVPLPFSSKKLSVIYFNIYILVLHFHCD